MKTFLMIFTTIASLGSIVCARADAVSQTWTTSAAPRYCPGHQQNYWPYESWSNAPTYTYMSFESLPNTWCWVTNNDERFFRWTPQLIGLNTNTPVESASLTCNYNTQVVNRGYVRLQYPCCHDAGGVAFRVYNNLTKSGGTPPETMIDDTFWDLGMVGGDSRGFAPATFQMVHIFNTNLNALSSHAFDLIERNNDSCPSTRTFPTLRYDFLGNPLQRKPDAFISTGEAGTYAELRTNSILDTNWVLATTFQYDGNGHINIPLTNWALPEEQCFFLLTTTNAT